MQQPSCDTKDVIVIQAPAKKRKTSQRNLILIGVLSICLLAVIILLVLPVRERGTSQQPQSSPSVTASPSEARIPKGTYISNINVGKMTAAEAAQKVDSSVSGKLTASPMCIHIGQDNVTIPAEISGVHWDIEAAVSAALNGKSTDLKPVLDRNAVQKALKDYYARYGGVYTASGYWLEGTAPDLASKTGSCQTLVIVKGADGVEADLDEIIRKMETAYQNGLFDVKIDPPGESRTAKELDLEEIYRLVHIDPINPHLNKEIMEPVEGVSGYGFNLDHVESMFSKAAPGDTLRIDMQFVEPDISLEDAWFLDTLGYCKTEHTDEENRNENLRLACNAINGRILQPGDVISYNEALGKRTTAAGYKPAPAYSGTELINEIGGGICQVSSTLYLSSLFAELKIVERKNHGFPTNYLPLGLDATVNWGTTDLKIRNDYEYPVKIIAEVDDLYVSVKIMGVDLRDYYVKMEYRVDDHPSYAAAYRCRYDLETDEEIDRQLDHTSPYLEDVWCWPGYAENAKDDP